MTPTQAENLRILIRHMETNVSRTLNMRNVFEQCGTPARALGEAYTLKELREAGLRRAGISATAEQVFGISRQEVVHGIFSAFCDAWEQGEATPQQWATYARKVLSKHGYSMDDGFAAFKAKVLAPIDIESVSTAHGIALWPSVL